MSKDKISIEVFKKTAFENYEPVIEAEWHGIPVKVNKHLSFSGVLSFVDSVVESCFVADTGAYIPEARDFAVRCCILTMYGNFDLPDDLEQKYSLVYASDAVSFVVDRIDSSQFNQLMMAIDKKIEYKAQSNIEMINKQMNEIVANFNAMEEKLADVFRGIDGDTISKVAGAISNGSFDEKKLVQAFSENLPHKSDAESNIVPIFTEDK